MITASFGSPIVRLADFDFLDRLRLRTVGIRIDPFFYATMRLESERLEVDELRKCYWTTHVALKHPGRK